MTYTGIIAPGAGTKAGQGTVAESINDRKPSLVCMNTGSWPNGTQVYHGFVRSASGGYTTFDVAGAGTKAGQGYPNWFPSTRVERSRVLTTTATA